MEWEDTINKMIERGATGSGKEFETVFEYLLANYGKIYINDAGADDIVKIVGLSRKDADAIVAYRTDQRRLCRPGCRLEGPGHRSQGARVRNQSHLGLTNQPKSTGVATLLSPGCGCGPPAEGLSFERPIR